MSKEEKEVVVLRPSDIRYTQSTISNKFTDGGLIGVLLDDVVVGRCFLTSIKRIEVKLVDGVWFSADNRRLWVFKQLEFLGHCPAVQVKVVNYVHSKKCTSENGGLEVTVRGGDPGGIWFSKIQEIKKAQVGDRSNRLSKADTVKVGKKIPSDSIENSKCPVFQHDSIQYTRVNPAKVVSGKTVRKRNELTNRVSSNKKQKKSAELTEKVNVSVQLNKILINARNLSGILILILQKHK